MKRDCRRALILAPQSSAHIAPLLLIIVAAVAVATCAPSTSSAAATTSASGPLYQTSVVPITNRSSHPACQTWAFVTATTSQPGNGLRRWRRGITDVAVRAVQPGPGSSTDAGGGESGQGGGIAVHDDSWHLGNGGFAEGHLEDEERVAAKKVRWSLCAERAFLPCGDCSRVMASSFYCVRWVHALLRCCGPACQQTSAISSFSTAQVSSTTYACRAMTFAACIIASAQSIRPADSKYIMVRVEIYRVPKTPSVALDPCT